MINGISLQLYRYGLQASDIYPELKKYFYKEDSDVTWEGLLTTKFALQVDTRLSTNNILDGSGRAVEKSILLQIEKAPEANGGDLTCHVLSLEDTTARLNVTDLSRILMIERQGSINMSQKDATRRRTPQNGSVLRVGKFLGLEKMLMSVKGLDECEMPTRNDIKAAPNEAGG